MTRFFGDPAGWPDDDYLGYSVGFTADVVLTGYAEGVFPMPEHDNGWHGEILWWSPMQRGVLPLENFRATRSMRQSAKHYRVSVDECFRDVVAACGDPSRPDGWIDDAIMRVYGELYDRGVAHSVEVWRGEELVGGLYGVCIGGLFAGESMFHHPERGRDASKVALMKLVEILSQDEVPRLLDVQWLTPHLASLGVVEIARAEYLSRLAAALELAPPDWAAAR